MMIFRNAIKSELKLERHEFLKFSKESTAKKFKEKTMQFHNSGK